LIKTALGRAVNKSGSAAALSWKPLSHPPIPSPARATIAPDRSSIVNAASVMYRTDLSSKKYARRQARSALRLACMVKI